MSEKLCHFHIFSEKGDQLARTSVSVIDNKSDSNDYFLEKLPKPENNTNAPTASVTFDSNSDLYGCIVCCYRCATLNEQRDHFQSDWHIFNVRRRSRSKATVNEKEFEIKITKKEYSSSDDDSDSDTEVHDVVLDSSYKSLDPGASFFVTNDNVVFSCYRCVLTPLRSYQVQSGELLEHLRMLLSSNGLWIVLTLSGGNFAGAVFDVRKSVEEALVHKTMHRYTERKKQGGSQIVRDKQQQAKPKSAGASLRRQNEVALCQDIRDLLTDWREYLRQASLIFLRCSMYRRYIFFEGKQPILNKNDVRIRNIPFATSKPTYEETKRIAQQLSSFRVHGPVKEFTERFRNESAPVDKPLKPPMSKTRPKKNANEFQDEDDKEEICQKKVTAKELFNDQLASLTLENKKTPEPSTFDISNSENISRDLERRVFTAVKTGDLETVRTIYENSKDAIFQYLDSPFSTKNGSTTFLHTVSASGQAELLKYLLDIGCDPTVRNKETRVPYQVANGKAMRKIFVQFREDYPTRWNWNAAQIPEPVDSETEARRDAKLAEKRKMAAKIKSERAKEKRAVEAQAKVEKEERERYLNLSDREKRALAAERRWQTENSATMNVVLSRCFKCASDITGKVPFEYNENRFCSVKCLKEHRVTNS